LCALIGCHCTKVYIKSAKLVDEKIIDCFVVYNLSVREFESKNIDQKSTSYKLKKPV